ncbi:MAG TPA: SLC13 family permease [Planctomycetota bacterium]|nr:SLC13 family permease [Planctomycetota bacterium]
MSHGVPDADLPTGLHYLDSSRGWLLARRGWRVAMVILVLAGLVGGFLASNDLPVKANASGLSQSGARTLAIFLAAVILWVTEAVPLVVTGLGVFVALVAGGIGSPAQVSAWFGDRVVFFLLGIFLIAGALTSSHVVDHAALRLLNAVGTSPRKLRQGVYWVAFFSSFLLAEHAVAAMLFPVIARIRDALGRPRQSSSYVAGLFLALAWGCSIGGIVTYLGGARIALAMGIAQTKGITVPGFFELAAMSLPIAVPFGIAAAIILEIAFPIDVPNVTQAREALAERRRDLGRFGPRQRAVLCILLLTIAAWAFFGVKYLAPVALASASVLISTGLGRWSEVERHVPWDLLIMEAGALALCSALEATGASVWAGHIAFSNIGHEPVLIIGAIAMFTIILTELFSNPAVVTLLVPLLIPAAPALGFQGHEIALVLAVALPCGLSFVLPLGSPPLAIAFSSGEYKVAKVAGWGILLDLIPVPLTMAAFWFFWR